MSLFYGPLYEAVKRSDKIHHICVSIYLVTLLCKIQAVSSQIKIKLSNISKYPIKVTGRNITIPRPKLSFHIG